MSFHTAWALSGHVEDEPTCPLPLIGTVHKRLEHNRGDPAPIAAADRSGELEATTEQLRGLLG